MGSKAVQFGAGNIGRGFMGQLFYESGLETTFVDVHQPTIDALNERHSYPIHLVSDTTTVLTVSGVDALHSSDMDGVVDAIATADIMATAVGANILPRIAPVVAAGLSRRLQAKHPMPLNIILCENLLHAGKIFGDLLEPHFPAALQSDWRKYVGLVEASIGRMVPVMTEAQRADDPLLVCVEPYCELPVDASAMRGPVPHIANMKAMSNFQAYVERKLYIHNAGHAATAYLGYRHNHEYIWQAIGDPDVHGAVKAMMNEARAGLVARHGMSDHALADHIADLLHRFGNKALGDQVTRVARDPVRKLQPGDRLLGTIDLCLDTNTPAAASGFATAAAIRYDQPEDEAARAVQDVFERQGLDGVLQHICGLEPHSPLIAPIREGHDRLIRDGWIGTSKHA